MKNFWKDFKAFISRGNILDMAVGVIMGSALGAIVTSLVNDIIMPLVALARACPSCAWCSTVNRSFWRTGPKTRPR